MMLLDGDKTTASVLSRRITVCHGSRPWLTGWKEIGAYCGFGGADGTGASRTGRKWEGLYGLPVHRLPDNRPRAIPFELDAWLMEFAKAWKNARPRTEPRDSRDWKASRADRARTSPSGIQIPGD